MGLLTNSSACGEVVRVDGVPRLQPTYWTVSAANRCPCGSR